MNFRAEPRLKGRRFPEERRKASQADVSRAKEQSQERTVVSSLSRGDGGVAWLRRLAGVSED